MKKFAIILAGCGRADGAEIHESVLAMLAVCRRGCSYQVFAPDIMQHHTVNHVTGEEQTDVRNVMVEAARISRGDIKPLESFDASQYDALIFAGGFGVAKNLCDFAFAGDDYEVLRPVTAAIQSMHTSGKPVGAMCISPLLIADAIPGVELTFGDACDASRAAEKRGARHRVTTHCNVVVDTRNRVVTVPCYMLDATIAQVATEADRMVEALMSMMQ